MVQNPSKQSLPARLAREQGAQITHILPLDASGHHTLAADSGVWGCIGRHTPAHTQAPLPLRTVPAPMRAARARGAGAGLCRGTASIRAVMACRECA